ncbi:uncharacterized protein [Clytia hemisphaerica]
MSRHNKETSFVRNVLGDIDNISYTPNRLYDKDKTKKGKTKAPQRLLINVTFYQYPGDGIMSSRNKGIKEAVLKVICTGTAIQLFTDMNEGQVKSKLIEHLAREKQTELDSNKIKLIYMKRKGRGQANKELVPISSDPGVVYDGVAIKDIFSGASAKNLVVLLGSKVIFHDDDQTTTSTPRVRSNRIEINSDSDSNDSDALPTPFIGTTFRTGQTASSSSTPARIKRKKTSTVCGPRKAAKKVVDVDNSDSIPSLELDQLDELSKNVYGTIDPEDNAANSLLAVLIVLRHLASFLEALNLSIEKDGHNASKLELSLAQVMILFENDKLSDCWMMALSELAALLHLKENSASVGDVLKILMKELCNLDSETWKEFFIIPCLSSELITDYRGENGSEQISTRNPETINFEDNEEGNLKDMLNSFIQRKESKFPYDDDKFDISEGESVYTRKFYQRLPELLFMEFQDDDITNQQKLILVEEFKQIALQDTQTFNKNKYNLAAVVAFSKKNKYFVAIRHRSQKSVKVYANGCIYFTKVSLETFAKENLQHCRKVFAMYSGSTGTDMNLNTLVDEPSIDSIEMFGKFLFERLSTKQAIQVSEKSSTQKSRNNSEEGRNSCEREFEEINSKLKSRLSLIEGQRELKASIFTWARHILMQNLKRQNDVGSMSKPEIISNLHMILSGNPGTGKTMVARCMAGILYDIGLLESPDIVEVQKEEIVSGFVSSTSNKCLEVIKSAYGKVMFIDEAYQLCPKKSMQNHGAEALETIMRYMHPSISADIVNPVFIFAGYPADMTKFLTSINRGMSRRIKERFEFLDYTPDELANITLHKMLRQRLSIPYGIEKTLAEGFSVIPSSIRAEHNGSLCQDMYREVVVCQESRLKFNASIDELKSYTKEDFEKGVYAMLKKFQRIEEASQRMSVVEYFNSTEIGDGFNLALQKLSDKHKQKINEGDVWLHIPGVGMIPGSPVTPKKE